MKYRLKDLIDIGHFQGLQDRLNEIYSFPSSIIDNDGNILTATAWQDVCTKFHRKNKESERLCIKSDQYILGHLHEANPAVSYRCPHGLVDNALPIIIDGIHYGNFFTGQFFLAAPDLEFFTAQAKKYGFDEKAYIEAVKKVPTWTQEQLDSYLFFIKSLITIISESGLKKLKEIENRKHIQKSEKKYRSILKAALDGFWLTDTNGRLLEVNDTYCRMSGYSENELLCMTIHDFEAVETPEIIAEHMQKVISKGSDRFESKHRHKDGSVFDVEVSIQFRSEEGGKCVCFIRDITDRKEAENELREKEDRFNLAMEASKDGLYEWDLETREIYYSPGWKRMLGYEPDELANDFSVWEKLTKPEDVQRSWQVMNEVVEGKRERFVAEFEMLHKKGHWVNVLSRANLYKNSEGKPVRVIGTHVDITGNKRQQDRLRLSESRYRKAQQMGKVGNWEFDMQTLEFWGSDEAKRIYGFDLAKDAFPIEEVESCIPERDRVHQAMVDLIERGTPYDLEFDIITKDTGKTKTIISIAELEKDAAGTPEKISGVVQDITRRKQAENALESERRFLTTVFDNIEEAIVICDENGTLTRFNEAARRLHGLPEEHIMPEHWAEYYSLFRKDGVTPMPVEEIPLYRALKGQYVHRAEMIVAARNKSSRYLVCNGQSLTDHTGTIIGAVVVMHDDTERRNAEIEREKLQSQLHVTQKMESVGRLAGGVAHDFNNMLGVILGHTELALSEADENHDLYSDLKEIQKAAERSADITKQLLAFARKQTISPKRLGLNDTVQNMLNMLRRLIGEDINLVWQPAAHIWPVKMDPSQIDQILVNLCVNARDAFSGVGNVTIETGKASFDEKYCSESPDFVPGDFVLLAVSDNGCGMDKETMENLFEPFFTTKDVGKGTGMGLATVYGIVKQNNGFINVYSEPGQGSTFKIYLPRFFEDEETDMGVPEKRAAAGGTETILLVEDEPTILRMTRMMLERKGYTVITAATPAEAVEKAGNHTGFIDLLMTDVVMPEMNGRDLALQITELYPGIRHLFMSGYTANVIAHQGVLDDGVAFIQKPFSMADMTLKVREVLDTAPDKNQG